MSRRAKRARARAPPQGRASWRLHAVSHSAALARRDSRACKASAPAPAAAHRQRACAWALPLEKPPSLSPKSSPPEISCFSKVSLSCSSSTWLG